MRSPRFGASESDRPVNGYPVSTQPEQTRQSSLNGWNPDLLSDVAKVAMKNPTGLGHLPAVRTRHHRWRSVKRDSGPVPPHPYREQRREMRFGFTVLASALLLEATVLGASGPVRVPIEIGLDIVPGSALDFSGLGDRHRPAGTYGRLLAAGDGRFAFRDKPNRPARFYGVDLCLRGPHTSRAGADRLTERLMRLGYNAVRLRHYEELIVDRNGGTSTRFKPGGLDQLDTLFAVLKKRGIYVALDLYASRRVFVGEIWPGESGNLEIDEFKMLVAVNAAAQANWRRFARNLLGHVNPYTGMRYADDPALAWICLINEGNYASLLGNLSDRVEKSWLAAWNRWLHTRYDSVDALWKAWGEKPEGRFGENRVPLPDGTAPNSPKGRDLARFLAVTETAWFRRMKAFLRDELGTTVLLTNNNGRPNDTYSQLPRREYDYVDARVSVEPPRPPDPLRAGSPGGDPSVKPMPTTSPGPADSAFVRLFGKPFTVGEFNGSDSNRAGRGLLIGSLGALQDWSAIWRLTCNHGRGSPSTPEPTNRFDPIRDPLAQAAERGALCLFLRGDMKRARHTVALVMQAEDLAAGLLEVRPLSPPWSALAWAVRMGTVLNPRATAAPADLLLPMGDSDNAKHVLKDAAPYAAGTGERLVQEFRTRKWFGEANPTDLTRRVIQSETGELLREPDRETFSIDTPRTAGGYAPAGSSIRTEAVTVTLAETGAAVWVSSLDDNPVSKSRLLLVTHITDQPNSGAVHVEQARRFPAARGDSPRLVHTGQAVVRIRRDRESKADVYALSTNGRPLEAVPCRFEDDTLVLPLSIQSRTGTRLNYEILFD